jgi:hypothetical protein
VEEEHQDQIQYFQQLHQQEAEDLLQLVEVLVFQEVQAQEEQVLEDLEQALQEILHQLVHHKEIQVVMV